MPAPLNSQREDQRDAAARLAQALAQLTDDEREQLTAHRRRLIFELDILRARIPRE